jgi:hypothetical protein
MNSHFKFPRRVRIHGGECGAVARALHHEVKGLSLYQADSGKALGSTIERKQMSTKTTLKRISLAAVSALGMGLLSVVPANAAASTFTSSTSISTTSMTVVSTSAAASQGGKFYLDVFGNEDMLTTASQGLFGSESISVTVTGIPTATFSTAATTDIAIQPVILADNTIGATEATGASAFTAVGDSARGAQQIPNQGSVGSTDTFASNNFSASTTYTDGRMNRYWFHISPAVAGAIDGGAYTIRVRTHALEGSTRVLLDKTITVNFVSDIANATGALTVTKSGDVYKGEGLSFKTGQSVTATLTNGTAGGRLIMGSAAANGLDYVDPALNANFMTTSTTAGQALVAYDNGVAGEDHVAPSTYPAYSANAKTGDGVYGITTIASTGTAAAAVTEDASAEKTIRVRITGTSVSTTVAIVILATTTARDIFTDLTLSVAGSVVYNSTAAVSTATAGDVTLSNVESSTTYLLPLSATSATLTINLDSADNTAAPGAIVKVTPTWSGSYASASVTPAASTTGTNYTADASGNVKYAVTNASPIDGAQVSLALSGFASGAGTVGTGSRTVILKWVKPAVTTMSVSDPLAGTIVKTGSTTVFSVAVLDQFGNAMAGELVTPAISTSTNANYVLNKTYAAVTTDASGIATFSLTDAAAEADDVDTVSFTSVSATGVSASRTITYDTALPVVATLTMYANLDMGEAATALLSSSGLGATTALTIETARNQSRNLNSFADHATTDDMVSFKATAVTSTGVDADGAVCTIDASAGAHILSSSSGLPTTSAKKVVTSGAISWNAIATTPGTKTYTVTCGTATATAKMTVNNDASDARFVTITGGTTGSANGDGVPVTVSVTDRFGNGVSGVALTVTASGVGSFSGGATSQSFTTDATGKYTFLATSTIDAGGSATFSASGSATTTDFKSVAGYAGATVIDSTVAAGNSSATHTVTFAAGANKATAAAEAATDAAAEAIDAANAATDAANLAAEAADAATVAAEEARDAADAATAAVEELATQVATLMAALKAQITTLANTVAKIAKKVKA